MSLCKILKGGSATSAELQRQLDECRKERDTYKELATGLEQKHIELSQRLTLLTEGPEPPLLEELKVLPQGILEQLLKQTLGARFTQCPNKLWSDGDWIVCSKSHVDRYLDYYSEHWLPLAKPYKIIIVEGKEVWARDCDNFADLMVGLPTIHHVHWSGLTWGMLWGNVEGSIMGPHAFDAIVSCDDTYNGKNTTGLDLWLLEPQWGDIWEPRSGKSEVVGYQPRSPKDYRVIDLWATKF